MNKYYNLEDVHKAIESIWESNIKEKLKKDIFDLLIWRVTEINGKYNTQYRSKMALEIKDTKLLHHEHVISRKYLKERLLKAKNKKELKEIMDSILACVVLREEHKKLKNDIEGFERYKKVGIEIVDTYKK